MELKDFTEAEKEILTLAVLKVGNYFTVKLILSFTKLSEEETERALNSLIAKGIASIKKPISGETSYKFTYGLRDGKFVDMKQEEDRYWDDYQDFLRGTVCP